MLIYLTRSLFRRAGLPLVIIVMLALAIGANAAVRKALAVDPLTALRSE